MFIHRSVIIFITFIFFYLAAQASSSVSSVAAHQEGENIVISYQLSKLSDVIVSVSTDSAATYTPLKSVTGDVGVAISAGSKSIVWNVLADYENFSFDNVSFKVEANSDAYLTVQLPSGDRFVMVYVQGGQFTMGCSDDQQDKCEEDENPAHQVMLNDYYLGQTEVTQGLWQAVMGNSIEWQQYKMNTTLSSGIGADLPMYYVNHGEAEQFCRRLNFMVRSQLPQGYKFSLPTEAQWEYAARGGNRDCPSLYAGGDSIAQYAWYAENANDSVQVVGIKAPNELAIYDMSGNVSEWCSDWYSSSYYSKSPNNNPINTSKSSSRVIRGGSWYYDAASCRVSFRNSISPDSRNNRIGFRLALVRDDAD
jgi:formylglycine-generating enzyme required for sulfatase activity